MDQEGLRRKWHKYWENSPIKMRTFLFLLIGLLITAFSFHFFVELADEVQDNELRKFDGTVANWVINRRTNFWDNFYMALTQLGDTEAYFILVPIFGILLLVFKKNWLLTIEALVVLLLASGVNRVLKTYFGRARPEEGALLELATHSFPSGHAMSAIAFYGFMIYVVWILVKPVWLQITLSILLAVLILLIGISRVYLGVHFASDVLAGFSGGLFWLAGCIVVFNLLRIVLRKKHLKQ